MFMAKVTSQLCELVGVKKIRTFLYYPQSNGALERFHACLKKAFRKTPDAETQWDVNLKYILFDYHNVGQGLPLRINIWKECEGPP